MNFKFKKLYLFAVVALITMIFMYIDSSIFDKRYAVFTYFKNMIYCGSLSVIVFLFANKMNNTNFNYNQPVNQSNNYNDPTNNYYGNYLPHNENILTGIPPNY